MNDGFVVLDLTGVLARLLTVPVPAAGQNVKVKAELAYFPASQEAGRWLSSRKTPSTPVEICCRGMFEIFASVFVERLSSLYA